MSVIKCQCNVGINFQITVITDNYKNLKIIVNKRPHPQKVSKLRIKKLNFTGNCWDTVANVMENAIMTLESNQVTHFPV